MSTMFAKEEMIQANELRSISQKSLKEQLRSHDKLGLLFRDTGLDAVMMSYERYAALVERLEELENEIEDTEIALQFGDRVHTAPEEWVPRKEGMSTLEMYRQRQREKENEE